MEALLEQLGLNFKLLFIQIIGFLLLYWILKKFLFGRVMEMIQKRGDEIRGSYENNERTREELQELKQTYEQKLREARVEADSIVQQARDQAEKAGRELIEKTQQEASQIRDRGLADLEQEKKRVIAEIKTEVINLSVDIASRIIEKAVEPADAQRLADDVIKQTGGLRQ